MAWQASRELRDAGHSGLLALPTDIASESSVAGAYEQIDSDLPPVVGLVNLAGIACPAPLHECSLEEFERYPSPGRSCPVH